MKKAVLTVLLFTFAALVAMAQNANGRRQRFDPTEVHARTAERLVKQMKLDDEKEEAFKVLYLDYQTARSNAANPKGGNENEEVDLKKITDEQAMELIEKRLSAQEAQLKVDREYLPKFLELITPAQAAHVFVGRTGAQGSRSVQGSMMRPGGMMGGGMNMGGFGGFPDGAPF